MLGSDIKVSYRYTFAVVWLLSRVWVPVTPWTAVHLVSLLLKLRSIESVMPFKHLLLCRPLLLLPSIFPNIRSFPVSQFFESGGQRIGVSASASVLPMNIQDWFPWGWTAWISLQSQETLKSLLQHHSLNVSVLLLSLLNYSSTLTSVLFR